MNAAIVPVATRGIATREQFHAALSAVNHMANRSDLSIDAAKDTLTKAEALRAWASFDKKLTVDEKKEANRAVARTVHMLAELAEREQPGRVRPGAGIGGRNPGPIAWLQRELHLKHSRALSMRRLATSPEIYRVVLETGAHWLSVVKNSLGRSPGCLTRTLQFVKSTNSLRRALEITPQHLQNELSRIRKIKAWCEAYEHALVQRQARGK